MKLNVGVVGATGMVGEVFLEIMAKHNFPMGHLRLFASEKSRGVTRKFNGHAISVQSLEEGCFKGLDLVFFSSGDEISKEWAPRAVSEGAYAVDNSAAFRMDAKTPLVVPEVNGELLASLTQPSIIANPNCSTIQLVVALKPLQDKFGLTHVRVSTYQSVSGAGRPGVEELEAQLEARAKNHELKAQAFPHPIAFNCIPQIGSFDSNGYCSEEVKIMNETKKILNQPKLKVSAFTVRVPTFNGHAEAVWVKLKERASRTEVCQALKSQSGLVVIDDPTDYPTQLTSSGQDPVFVGRIHGDQDNPKVYLMWVAADNILKGAALNGLQIAQRIFDIS